MEKIKVLRPLIQLQKDEFFCVRVLQRRKDNPDLEHGVKQLKVYTFYSWEELEENVTNIVEICDTQNARAYIRLNKQNALDVSLRCIQEMTENLIQGNPRNNEKVWNSVIGKKGSHDWWVLDIDEHHLEYKNDILLDLRKEYSNRQNKVVDKAVADLRNLFSKERVAGYLEVDRSREKTMFPIIENPTKSGVHLICRPFDTRILESYNQSLQVKGLPQIDIQKDSNTVLYIGK